jgi:hypothetical protein
MDFLRVDAMAAASEHFVANHKVELGMMLFGNSEVVVCSMLCSCQRRVLL